MGKKKKNNERRSGNRFFRWIRSDLPDEEEKKSPVLLLGVNKITDSPSFLRRRSSEFQVSGSTRFFRPPKSKHTRGLQDDERLEKIRQDLLTHKHKNYIPTTNDNEITNFDEARPCLKLNCAGNCRGCQRYNNSNRGSFSFHRPDKRQSSLCPSEPYGISEQGSSKDYSEHDIEFKYTEYIQSNLQQPCSSKNSSYNVTPKSADRRHFLLANLNERFKKTLSLDSRKLDTNRIPLSLPQESRPKSLINTSNILTQPYKSGDFAVGPDKNNQKKKRFRPRSFFSLETFFDSKRSDSSSIDDYSSSKYKRFELGSDESPILNREWSTSNHERRERTPDLLDLPVIIDSVRKRQSDTKRQLDKLENHYYASLSKKVVDAVPRDATNTLSGNDDDDVEYIEPIRSNFTSQSTLTLDSKNIPHDLHLKPDSILTINTDETDIRLPSSTVSPKSNIEVNHLELDLDSIGAYEIEVKESDLLVDRSKDLIVKVMDKSIDSIGSCSLDVDASTDFSDTTSGSLNLLTPSSTTSRIRDFTTRFQERAASANVQPSNRHLLAQASLNPSQLTSLSPSRTPVEGNQLKPEPRHDNLLKPPPPKVIVNDNLSHRSRTHHKKRDEPPQKKPSYLNLACSVNGYTNLTTYDSKLRQDINKSRESSPIRPITHNYQYRSDNNSLVVPIPIGVNKLLVPTFIPHDIRTDLTAKTPTKAHTDPNIAPPSHAYMAAENKQLKNDFLGPNMTSSYVTNESKTFAASMLHNTKTDEVDHAFKSSYSETNFMSRRSTNNGQTVSSESYTIHNSNGVSKRVDITKEHGESLPSPIKSFIQQRVERLYGPGALAQGFFNQKRYKTKSDTDDIEPKLLSDKLFCDTFTKRTSEYYDEDYSPNCDLDLSLPVLRHLRPEFRAQLPIVSPKKNKSDISPVKPVLPAADVAEKTTKTEIKNASDVVNSSVDVLSNGVSVIDLDANENVNGSGAERDGHYFLVLEKKETERLLALAASADRELESLQNESVSEEVLGLLRAASGKARLLATQKMKQFEGLCYKNVNKRDGEPFPTTAQDLQGFWDMVCLQVRNVDALYDHVAQLKLNGWREVTPAPTCPPVADKSTPRSNGARAPRQATPSTVKNEKARLAAEKRDADRRAMLEHRRRVAREKQLAARSLPGDDPTATSTTEGAQEVEIFVGKSPLPPRQAPIGDCETGNVNVSRHTS